MGSADIWARYSKTGDQSLKDELVLKHLGLVKYLAGRLMVNAPPGITREDLEGYGVIGLLDAIDKFNVKMGTEFKNYAYTRIRGAILDEIRKQSWVPRSKWQKLHQYNKLKERYWQNGEMPDERILAGEMGVDAVRLRQLAAEYSSAFIISLEDGVGTDGEGVLADTIKDENSPDPLDIIALQDEKQTLAQAIRDLPERDRLVLALYYQEELTLKEIGSVLEVTESRVCQLHSKALRKLKAKLTGEEKGAR
ncbi:sigma-70 family RNA polymerase sigma factor [Desulfallas thermosapovorans]|uniref:RNA polymerase sigma-28 (SigD/FliA/WhiG) subunit n=1 Tax=Desulfallas thermosapovorans DSM 6562 TaxID=1121431 RepID=A0A5S4ZVQ7_9FIRM|nr:FliA/WhiG family RNA polymerase sigma factor [Desulfallas thermosapovorans]TYO96291.1 RNA polymerase sigma-28 (SigD/FliA/WhiG) subunit [Desulfallas thermosapovorans DSM 6562]